MSELNACPVFTLPHRDRFIRYAMKSEANGQWPQCGYPVGYYR